MLLHSVIPSHPAFPLLFFLYRRNAQTLPHHVLTDLLTIAENHLCTFYFAQNTFWKQIASVLCKQEPPLHRPFLYRTRFCMQIASFLCKLEPPLHPPLHPTLHPKHASACKLHPHCANWNHLCTHLCTLLCTLLCTVFHQICTKMSSWDLECQAHSNVYTHDS